MYKALDKNRINKYINGAKPKIGWEGEKNLNHFNLVSLIARKEYGITREVIWNHLSNDKLDHCEEVIKLEFRQILSDERRSLIIHCLQQRRNKLIEIMEAYDK